ncbi:PREDICTED: neurogenic locus notch homolog protein 1-like [Branchiostoma belcheri]|uniref:Neurogenic locus notch homolog protein 1-like n=1 Tax=Branchiostoma belcheri TaxID=7741 RepID=A0A6P5A8W6_BRABE|nr:PREDICTED: neurogenic locus notch homolog protein 1-like [Branchiostoma belcheri]
MWSLLFLIFAVAACPVQSQAGTFIVYDYFKVQAYGQMSSENLKLTCERADYVTPCPGNESCPSSTDGCVPTGLTACGAPMLELAQFLCGGMPNECPALDGVYCFYGPGAACGVEGDSWCAAGYDRYALCARDIDDCSSAPCQNGAVCQDGVNSFTCQCVPGYTGTLCETDIDECASSPCLGGGTCVDHVNGYSCFCPKGHVGDKCETVPYTGGCLLFSSDAVSYPEASQECQTRGGHLVDVKEAELQRLIADSIPAGSDVSPWIGLKMSMTYTDGTSASGQLQWSAGEPDNCDLCGFLDNTDDFRAKTASCMEQHHYVCQSGG